MFELRCFAGIPACDKYKKRVSLLAKFCGTSAMNMRQVVARSVTLGIMLVMCCTSWSKVYSPNIWNKYERNIKGLIMQLLVTAAKRSKHPTCPAIDGGLEVTFKPLVPSCVMTSRCRSNSSCCHPQLSFEWIVWPHSSAYTELIFRLYKLRTL
ncbi:hypothetical protein J6590_085179 [Homalodisca vitripennis]|nr:hypothetical protein J6590_085179 [Homalodisca vitripennis]